MADSKVSALTAVSSVTGSQEFLVNDAAVSKKATGTQIQTFVLASYAGASSIVTLGTVATGTWNATAISLAKGGTGSALTDPAADRIMFWDDSAGVVDWLTLGTNLSITGTTINASGGGITNGAGNNVIPKSDGTNLVASVLSEASGHIILGASARLGSAYQDGYISFHDDTTQNAIRFFPEGTEGSYWKTFETGTGASTELVFQFVPRATGAVYGGLTNFDSYSSDMTIGVTGNKLLRLTGTNRLGIGHTASANVSSILDILSTASQVKVRYDVNNYLGITVASTGATTLDIASDNGTPVFTFAKQIKSSLTGGGAVGLDFAVSDTYANMRIIRNATGSGDKHLYLNYDAGATSNTKIYSNNTEVITVSGGNLVTVNGAVVPLSNDLAALGSASLSWSDLFLASGALINIANGNWVGTHSSGIMTVSTGDLRVTTAGTNAASVVTLDGTQTLGNKTLTAARIADLGFLADANGNELIIFDTVTSAVNEITYANAASGNYPRLTASGGGADVGIEFLVKGTGKFRFLASASGPAEIRLYEDADSGTNYVGLIAPATLGADRTLTLPDATDTLVGKATTDTFTNKRVTLRTGTTTSSATPTINTDNVDFYSITALTVAITSMTTNLSGTPTEAQKLHIAITGTAARAITWGSSFESSTATLPTTTVTTNRLDVGFIWNTVTSKWRCVAVA